MFDLQLRVSTITRLSDTKIRNVNVSELSLAWRVELWSPRSANQTACTSAMTASSLLRQWITLLPSHSFYTVHLLTIRQANWVHRQVGFYYNRNNKNPSVCNPSNRSLIWNLTAASGLLHHRWGGLCCRRKDSRNTPTLSIYGL